MATFRELMDAADRADKAGDAEAASRLVQIARGMTSGQAYEPSTDAATQLEQSAALLPQRADEGISTPPRPDRFGDTIADATRGPREAFRYHAGEATNPDNTAVDRLKSAGMAGLAGAGATYAAGAGLVGELAGGTPTQERQLARDLMMMGEVSAPELAGVSSTTRLAGSAGQKMARDAAKPVSDAARTARAADELSITPALGATSKTGAMAAAGLEKVPLSGGVIGQGNARFVADIESAYRDAVSRVGSAEGSAGAGAALKSGVDKFVTDFKAKSATLYDEVGRHIPAEKNIRADNTVAAIRDLETKFEGTPEIRKRLGIDRLAGLADDLENGAAWDTIKTLRTSIGENIGQVKGALSDMDEARLKHLYSKLTDDMEAGAKASGPAAEKAWKRANDYYSAGAKRIEEALDKTIRADSPERAFEAFVQIAKGDRSTSNIRRMHQIKKSVPADEWDTVAASIMDRLGKAPAGQQNAAGDVFSPSHFLTEWNKLGSEAKTILLTPRARKEMDQLAAVSEGAKRINAERNMSNTGTAVGLLATGAGGVASPVTTVAALGMANIAARTMTSPRFLRAMNKMARGDDKMMRAIARSDSPYAQDATTILRMSAAEAASGGRAANSNDARPAAAMR